jgi:hypothetical protein
MYANIYVGDLRPGGTLKKKLFTARYSGRALPLAPFSQPFWLPAVAAVYQEEQR